VDSPSSALLVWVWEHLGALLKSVDRLQRALARSELARTEAWDAMLLHHSHGDGPSELAASLNRQGKKARAAGAFDVASQVAQRLGLPLDHADNLPLVMAALDAAVKDAAAFRKLGEEVKTIAEDVGMDVQAVEDRTRAAATALCDRMADYDPGYTDALYASSVTAHDATGAARIEVIGRYYGTPAFVAHGDAENDAPADLARQRAEGVAGAGPLLWLRGRLLERLRGAP